MKLKLCPFCGARAFDVFSRALTDGHEYIGGVVCTKCPGRIDTINSYKNEAAAMRAAVKMWNRRATPPKEQME